MAKKAKGNRVQVCTPGKGTFLSEKDKVQHRTRGSMPSTGTSAIEKIGS
ncbi:hypothetical protein [Bacteroides sp. K03]|nr:hypothetical protein [Bacteroides sp. K03]